MTPSRLRVMTSGSFGSLIAGACVCGRSTGTPTVNSGAVTIKMTSSTSMTSTSGVTLISEIARQFVVGDDRRDRRDEAERGREQRLGDAGRDDGETGVFRGGDRLEAVHNAPDRAEQADKGGGRAHRREERHKALDPLHLAPERHIHDAFDTLLQAGAHRRRAEKTLGGTAPPFAHRGGEDRAHRVVRALADAIEQIVERAARPERLLEARRGVLQPAYPQALVENDRP